MGLPACPPTLPDREIVPDDGKKIAFRYNYDFGDNWEHEVLLEGIVEPDSNTKYPICLEGERACPPKDYGGIGGYEYLLEALAEFIWWRGNNSVPSTR